MAGLSFFGLMFSVFIKGKLNYSMGLVTTVYYKDGILSKYFIMQPYIMSRLCDINIYAYMYVYLPDSQQSTYKLIFALIAKFLATSTFAIMLLYTREVFPASLR